MHATSMLLKMKTKIKQLPLSLELPLNFINMDIELHIFFRGMKEAAKVNVLGTSARYHIYVDGFQLIFIVTNTRSGFVMVNALILDI